MVKKMTSVELMVEQNRRDDERSVGRIVGALQRPIDGVVMAGKLPTVDGFAPSRHDDSGNLIAGKPLTCAQLESSWHNYNRERERLEAKLLATVKRLHATQFKAVRQRFVVAQAAATTRAVMSAMQPDDIARIAAE